MSSSLTRQSLLRRIREGRQRVKWFIYDLEPIGTRLTNVNIICGSIVTVLTAAPAIGGQPLMDELVTADPSSVTRRLLFVTIALLSLFSTIAANLYKSHEIASRLGRAQVCDAKLDGLEALIELRQVSLEEAATRYVQYIAEIPFATKSRFLKLPAALDWVHGRIYKPKPNKAVDNTISCSGRVEGVGPGCHLWLAVEADGYIWPKEGEIFAEGDGSWEAIIYEDGATENFAVSLFVANGRANKKIRAWLDKGDATGNYEKMRRPSGVRRVARVEHLSSRSHPTRKS